MMSAGLRKDEVSASSPALLTAAAWPSSGVTHHACSSVNVKENYDKVHFTDGI